MGSSNIMLPVLVPSLVFGVFEGEGRKCSGSASMSIEHELGCTVIHPLFQIIVCNLSFFSFYLFFEYLIRFRI